MKVADELRELQKQYAESMGKKASTVQRTVDKIIHDLGRKTDPDWQALEQLTHKLAGSSGSYGFWGLYEILVYLEHNISNNTLPSLAAEQAADHLKRWVSFFMDHARIISENFENGLHINAETIDAQIETLRTELHATSIAA